MGMAVTTHLRSSFSDKPYPDPLKKPTFDPHYGFDRPRKVRDFPLTKRDLADSELTDEQKDYCAHFLLRYMKCYDDNFPIARKWLCTHERHDYDNCEMEDAVLRMKEYERQKRLLQREARKKAKTERLKEVN